MGFSLSDFIGDGKSAGTGHQGSGKKTAKKRAWGSGTTYSQHSAHLSSQGTKRNAVGAPKPEPPPPGKQKEIIHTSYGISGNTDPDKDQDMHEIGSKSVKMRPSSREEAMEEENKRFGGIIEKYNVKKKNKGSSAKPTPIVFPKTLLYKKK